MKIIETVIIQVIFGVMIVQCNTQIQDKTFERPCSGGLFSNFQSCQCQDGSEYDNESELRINCGAISNNPISSCVCSDGSSWIAGGKTSESPCGKWKNVAKCTCLNGESYKKRDLRKECKENENPITSCECKDGTTWE